MTLLLLVSTVQPVPARQTLDEAVAHFWDHAIDSAETAFRAVVASDAPADDRAQAFRYLGLFAWRYRKDHESARQAFQRAVALDVDLARTLAAWSRMETAAGDAAQGVRLARRALAASAAAADEARAARRLGEAALATGDPESLREAHTALTGLLPDNYSFLDFSRTALRVALQVGDGTAALHAWRSYYAAESARDDAGLLEDARRVLQMELPRWGNALASLEQRAALAQAFADAAMFEEAAVVAVGAGAGGPLTPPTDARTTEVLLYWEFLRDLDTMTSEYYRSIAVGTPDWDRFRATLDTLAAGLWHRLPWPHERPAYSLSAWAAEMRTRFRTFIRLVRVTGGPAIWYGHMIRDDSLAVEQYGHSAGLRYILVGGVVSDGFNGWGWDYQSRTAGSATDDYILEFRPAFAGAGGDAWWRLTDPAESRRRAEREAEGTAGDWARAADDPYAYLSGLELRLERQGMEALRDSLTALGLTGPALKEHFTAAYQEAIHKTMIVAHEGRHAIDRRMGLEDDPTEDKEFRAKLSQIAFAPFPRLAFRGIIVPGIGNTTSHGQANLRLMRGLVEWMQEHATEIEGIDADRPLLPQLDRLTDDQLRAACRSLDPLAES